MKYYTFFDIILYIKLEAENHIAETQNENHIAETQNQVLNSTKMMS